MDPESINNLKIGDRVFFIAYYKENTFSIFHLHEGIIENIEYTRQKLVGGNEGELVIDYFLIKTNSKEVKNNRDFESVFPENVFINKEDALKKLKEMMAAQLERLNRNRVDYQISINQCLRKIEKYEKEKLRS